MMRRRSRCLAGLLAVVCTVVLLAAGCGSGGSSEGDGSGGDGGGSAGTSIAGSGGGPAGGEGGGDAGEDLLDPVGCSNGDFVKNLSSRQSLVEDCEALVAFRNSLMLQHVISDLPEFRFDPNWGDGDISYWERIEIQDGRVVSIDMRTQVESLSGQIPS